MTKKACHHYLLLGEKRIQEIYDLYELRERARKKADELLLILSKHCKKKCGGEITEAFLLKMHEKTADEPQRALIWKAIEIIGNEVEQQVAIYKTK